MDANTRHVVGEHNLVQQVRDLLIKSETLANEVAKKELLLNSIEYKMFEVSNRVVKAHEFNQWIDAIVQEKTTQNDVAGNQSDCMIADRRVTSERQWSKLCDVLGKYMENLPQSEDRGGLVKKVDQWMAQRQCKEIKLEIEQKEHRSLINNIEDTIHKFSNVCSVLKKHMKEKKMTSQQQPGDHVAVDRVDEWLTRRKHNELKLAKENEEYKKIICNVENGISELDSKINSFTDCLATCDVNVVKKQQQQQQQQQKQQQGEETNGAKTLEEIETQIRGFDDEDGQFQIKDFSTWLSKLKLKMNELESNVENEKTVRSSKEKQHAMEREILNYLFNQKQKEISILKEKVTNKVLTLSDIKPVHLTARVEG